MSPTAYPSLPPPVQAALAPAATLEDAARFTRKLTHEHYENFSVVSVLLPKRLRQDFCNVYAFCRTADDLGDESPDRETALVLLDRFKAMTRECFAGRTETALFLALRQTIEKYSIPIEPFVDLIDAFEQDQRLARYNTVDQLLEYCSRSANPVGRLVLYMCGYRDAERQRLSDNTCTALQLVNFWQDVRRDLLDLDRIYLPRTSMAKFGLREDEIAQQVREGRVDQRARDVIRFEVGRAELLFAEGAKLLPMLDSEVRPQIALFGKGGRAICQAIRRQGFDTITHRPSLSKLQKGSLVLGTLVATLNPVRLLRSRRVPA